MIFVQIGSGKQSKLTRMSESDVTLEEMGALVLQIASKHQYPVDREVLCRALNMGIKGTKVSWYGHTSDDLLISKFVFLKQRDSAISGASYTEGATFELEMPNALFSETPQEKSAN